MGQVETSRAGNFNSKNFHMLNYVPYTFIFFYLELFEISEPWHSMLEAGLKAEHITGSPWHTVQSSWLDLTIY